MKKNNKWFLIGSIVLIVLLTIITIFLINKSNSMKIHFEGKEYSTLSDVPEEDLNNHFKLLINVLVGKSYDTFTDEDISIVVAHYLLNIYTSATDEQVKAFVKDYFNIDNYELKTGTYPFYVNGKNYPITITKEGNIYKSDLGGRGYPNPWNRYDYKEVKDKQIIMTHNYAYFDWTGTKVVELFGITKIYLESNGSSLYVKKIEYIPKQ